MRLTTLFFISLFLFSTTLSAQNWVNYESNSSERDIYDILEDGDDLWIASTGGLIKFNQKTNSRTVYQSYNSPFKGTQFFIKKAPDNTLWTGGNGGLFHLDSSKNTKQHHYIDEDGYFYSFEGIKFGNDGKTWVRANRGNFDCAYWCRCAGLFTLENDTFIRHDIKIANLLNLRTEYFTDNIVLDENGLYWGVSDGILFSYDGNKIVKKYTHRNSPLEKDLSTEIIFIDQQNTIWFSQELPSGEFIHFSFKAGVINTVAELSDYTGYKISDLYIGNDSKTRLFLEDERWNKGEIDLIAEFDGVDWTFIDLRNLPNLPPMPPTSYIQSPHDYTELKSIGESGTWWMQHLSADKKIKVYGLKGEEWTVFDIEINNFPSNFWTGVSSDCENNIWVYGLNNMMKFDWQNWEVINSQHFGFNEEDRVYFQNITLNQNSCDLWINLSCPECDKPEIFTYNEFDVKFLNLTDETIWSVQQDKEGITWVGSNEGLFRIEGTDTVVFNSSNSTLPNRITDLDFDSKGNTWVNCLHENKVFTNKSGAWKEVEGHPDFWATTKFLVDNEDNMFKVHFDRKYLKYENSNWKLDSFPKELRTVWDFIQDSKGIYWIATTKGLWKWDGMDSFENFNVLNSGIANQTVTKIHEDNFGNLWLLHKPGISLFNENGIHNQTSDLLKTKFESNFDFSVFPNPSEGVIRFSPLSSFHGDGIVKVYTVTGSFVKSFKMENEINLNLPNGIYILQYEIRNDIHREKLIISK